MRTAYRYLDDEQMDDWCEKAGKNTKGAFPFNIDNLEKFESLLMNVTTPQYEKFLLDRHIYGFDPGQFLLL